MRTPTYLSRDQLKSRLAVLLVLAVAAVLSWPRAVQGYVEAPMSLGAVIQQSTNIVIIKVEKVDKENNRIIYRKVKDLKGTHNGDVIKHNIGRGGFNPREWQYTMEWAEPGKIAIFFHNGSACETCIGNYWYQAYAGGEWWNLSHGEPFLLRSYAGKPQKLAQAVTAVLAGQEVAVSCMVDGNKDDLHMKRAKIQRLKVSLKLQDYNAKRDFVGWGGDADWVRLSGMPGFTQYTGLTRVDPEAQAITALDFDGDGKPDLCLVGASKLVLIQNGGESLNELALPSSGGCRAAVWADYNGDGKPDLLLAGLNGPKLYTNMGGGQFRDDSHLLPRERCYNLTSAAWIDYDGDGKPDILLGNGFHGLRLYRNVGAADKSRTPLLAGGWYYIGPFDYNNPQDFNKVHPPEKGVDLKAKYKGKNGEQAIWREGKFADGGINNLALFKPENNNNAAVYLYREIECNAPMEVPVSLGSDDTLTVWLNGEKIHSEDIQRACLPDQAQVNLKLRQGKNQLLMKICQGAGEWAFYFKFLKDVPTISWSFEDVSAKVGLGPAGIGSSAKGDTLTVADVNGDGRPDFLYGAGNGMLVLNTPTGFVEAKDSGISYKPGKVGPIFADFHGDGRLDLFVPQQGTSKLFRNDGKGKFTEVTGQAGDLAKPIGWATSAAAGDFYNDGKLHLLVGCLRGPNRFFRNLGNGKFKDETEALGLDQRIFNSQAVCMVDLNNDGVLDMVFNNEGQDSAVLLGNKALVAASKRTPVTVQVNGTSGVIGSRVKVVDKAGKEQGVQYICGGEGRGGQKPLLARFALQPGNYRVEVRYSSGVTRAKEITVKDLPMRGVIDDQTAKVD
jgi:hypothetical protein